jgi:hypothetical protein
MFNNTSNHPEPVPINALVLVQGTALGDWDDADMDQVDSKFMNSEHISVHYCMYIAC